MPPRSRRPYVPPHHREGYRPDRAARLAVVLAVVLILIAAASAHAAVCPGSHATQQQTARP